MREMKRIVKNITAILEYIRREQCKEYIQSFGAASLSEIIQSACDGDLNAASQGIAQFRVNVTTGDVMKYAEMLIGAGYEW